MKGFRKSYTLSPQAIDEISEDTVDYLNDNKISRELSLRVRLCMEEALLVLYDEFGEGLNLDLHFSKRLGKPYISVRYKEKKVNPRESSKRDEVSEMVLDGLGIQQAYSYHTGINKMTFTLPSSGVRQEVRLCAAVFLALVIGVLGGYIPVPIKSLLLDYFLLPVNDTFMKLLTMVAPVLIFLSVITSITKSVNSDEFGKLGKYIIGRFVIVTSLSGVIFAVVLSPFFNFDFGQNTGIASGFKDLFDMFMDIIPGNLFLPFVEGNMMQIILIAVILGIIILGLDNRVENVRGLLFDLKSIFSAAMELVCKALPLFVFTSLISTFWENGLGTIKSLWKPIIVAMMGECIYILVFTIFISLRYKVKIVKLIKKILPSFIVGMTTASSIAAYGKGMEVNKKNLGIKNKYSDLAYPLGISLYDSTYIALFIIIPYYLADVYAVPVSAFWFVKACIISLIITYASPQVSGGALVCLTILMSQLGIPLEGLSIASVIAMVLDFSTTGTKVFGQHLEMIIQSEHLGLINLDKLRE